MLLQAVTCKSLQTTEDAACCIVVADMQMLPVNSQAQCMHGHRAQKYSLLCCTRSGDIQCVPVTLPAPMSSSVKVL